MQVNLFNKTLIRLILFTLFAFVLIVGSTDKLFAQNYTENNDYIPDNFPTDLISREFRIPVDADSLLVIYPSESEGQVAAWRRSLYEDTGINIPFFAADKLNKDDLVDHHLIILGNINNNQWALELYKHRYAFSDAYFPGDNGFIIHPATSIWNYDRNVLVIGASHAKDLTAAFEDFLDQIAVDDNSIGALRTLKTDLDFPAPLPNVQSILDTALDNANTSMAPYATIANWGFSYHLSGDEKWAEHFRDAFYMLRDRARKTGRWVSESWTNLYFNHWRLMLVWDLIDDDPYFTDEDRRVLEEVLWGFTTFNRWMPNLNEDVSPPGEMRQNHTTFLALSLYFSHRYYKKKYDMRNLESMMVKVHRAFEQGQANSFVPNDDAGGYLKYGSLHTLSYMLAEDDLGYIESGRLKKNTNLLTAVFDNRGQQVSFGDVGGYSYKGPESRRDSELMFFSMAARFYNDPQYQWLYQWLGGGSNIPETVAIGEGNPGTIPVEDETKKFDFNSLYSGDYVGSMKEQYPSDFTGIQVIDLDNASRKWFGRRAWINERIPQKKNRYFHKIAFRRNFDANDEYLLLDGLSGLSHGHHDGNSILRLTWKDRIWLFDLDYIKYNTKYHNGVTVVRNGIQQDPPALTRLDFSGNGSNFGFTRSTSQDYSGADWERTIIWSKDRWFFILDHLQAQKPGDYRLTSRWRTRGDEVSLEGNHLSVKQGGKSFYIKSADNANRRMDFEADGYRHDWSRYPWGEDGLDILIAREDTHLDTGESFDFINLLTASDDLEDPGYDLLKVAENQYFVTDPESPLFIGLDPELLEHYDLSTDAAIFMIDSDNLYLINASQVHLEGFKLSKFSSPRHMVINIASGSINDLLGGEIQQSNTAMAESMRDLSAVVEKTGRLAYEVHPDDVSPTPESFGLEPAGLIKTGSRITARASTGGETVMGDEKGRILYVREGGALNTIRTGGAEITSVGTGDLDGDGVVEVIAGDREGNLYCYGLDGQLRWHHNITPYYGSDTSIKDITTGIIDDSEKPVVLAGSAGWKVTAVEPEGEIRWESQIFYHSLTRVKILDTGQGDRFVIAGTNYHTPFNVIDPETGIVNYYAWEEMGSEYLASTEYFGIHLTDMVFFDADRDGLKDIVFGTLSNQIHAVRAEDGSKIWETNVGDEVTILKQFTDPETGELNLLAGNDAGDLTLLGRNGNKLQRIELDGRITGIRVLPPEQGRIDIAVTTAEGDLFILDESLLIRATHRFNQPLNGLYISGREGRNHQLIVIGVDTIFKADYEPFHLRKSRYY